MNKDLKDIIAKISASAATIAIIGGISGFAGAEYQKAKPLPPQPLAHFPQRLNAIKSQAGQMQAETIILGDSLTEFAYTPQLCGADALNAGVSGATIEDIIGWADDIVSIHAPKRLIIAAGTNNAKPENSWKPVAETLTAYRSAIDRYKQYDIAIATVPPVARKSRSGFHLHTRRNSTKASGHWHKIPASN